MGSGYAWQWDGGGRRNGTEGLQGCWVQEIEICSRSRSGAGELEALQIGLRILQGVCVCECRVPKVSDEEKRESREQKSIYNINSSCLFSVQNSE